MDGRSRLSCGSVREAGQAVARDHRHAVGRARAEKRDFHFLSAGPPAPRLARCAPWVPCAHSASLAHSWLDEARLLLPLDEAHPQVVEKVVDQFGLRPVRGCRGSFPAACRSARSSARRREVRLAAFSGHRIGQIAEMHGGGRAEREDELREADAGLRCLHHRMLA